MVRSIILGPSTDAEYSKMTPFEIVFGHHVSVGICKPSIPGLDEHYGHLSEQFNTMTSYRKELLYLERIVNR